ncbi:MAG: iron complex outermembrane receptor protein, partial [Woeseiaceae bacterium]
RISVFGENIADEEYRTFSFDLAFLGFSTDVYGKPSWYGASVGYNF